MHCLDTLLQTWERLQVELHDQYSRERLQDFQDFCQRVSGLQTVAVVLLTPLPCLMVVILADAIPLQPIERGFAYSGGLWLRSIFTTGVHTLTLLVQCEAYIPSLLLSAWERIAIVLMVSVLSVAASYPIACLIGFPIPFIVSLMSVPWLTLFMTSLWLARGHLIRSDEATRAGIHEFVIMGWTQTVTTIVYQAFYAAFSQMSPTAQIKFVLLLPVFKLLQKNVINSLTRDKDDIKPEVVTFIVELFHSMFVSCCMQRSTSITTSFVLMVIDTTQACISLYDLNRIMGVVEVLAAANGLARDEFVAVALRVASLEPAAVLRGPHPTMVQSLPTEARGRVGGTRVYILPAMTSVGPPQSMPRISWIHPISRVARKGTTRTVTDALSGQHKAIFAHSVLRAMFIAEFLLLIEFVEVMIPTVYCKSVSNRARPPAEPRLLPAPDARDRRPIARDDPERALVRDHGALLLPHAARHDLAPPARLGAAPAGLRAADAGRARSIQADVLIPIRAAGHARAPRCELLVQVCVVSCVVTNDSSTRRNHLAWFMIVSPYEFRGSRGHGQQTVELLNLATTAKPRDEVIQSCSSASILISTEGPSAAADHVDKSDVSDHLIPRKVY